MNKKTQLLWSCPSAGQCKFRDIVSIRRGWGRGSGYKSVQQDNRGGKATKGKERDVQSYHKIEGEDKFKTMGYSSRARRQK